VAGTAGGGAGSVVVGVALVVVMGICNGSMLDRVTGPGPGDGVSR